MAAFDYSLIARSDEQFNQLMKRKKNWAAKEPGVILVFCIVGAIVILLSGLFLMKKMAARRAAKEHAASRA